MDRAAALIAVLFVFILGGCYEGWEYQEGTSPRPRPEPPTPEPKVLFFVLLETLSPSLAAFNDPVCFPVSGIAEYRQNEWNQRIQALAASLREVAQQVVVTNREIADDDCTTMSAVLNASLDGDPWNPSPAPADDPLDRPLIHLKAVFWDEDMAVDPQPQVTETHWRAFEDLIGKGRSVLSLHYFVLTSEVDGYFAQWRDALPASFVKSAPGIAFDDIDATPGGINKRVEIISRDTADVVQWVVQGGGA